MRRTVKALAVLSAGAILLAGCLRLFRDGEVDSAWRVVRSDPGSAVIVVQSAHGGCAIFKELSAREDKDEVSIRVTSSVPRGGCDDYAGAECHSIELSGALGARSIRGPRQISGVGDPAGLGDITRACQGSTRKVEAKRR